MFRLRSTTVLFVLFPLVSSVFVLGSLASDGEDVAMSAIGEAEDSVGLAYEAVLEAEEAGANVSSLLTRLNVAAEHLARAHVAFGKGDFAGAIDDAARSREIADEVKADAVELKEWAPQERFQYLLSSMVRSMIAIGVIGVGSVISWHVFKHRYKRRFSETKREMTEDGAQRIS